MKRNTISLRSYPELIQELSEIQNERIILGKESAKNKVSLTRLTLTLAKLLKERKDIRDIIVNARIRE